MGYKVIRNVICSGQSTCKTVSSWLLETGRVDFLVELQGCFYFVTDAFVGSLLRKQDTDVKHSKETWGTSLQKH